MISEQEFLTQTDHRNRLEKLSSFASLFTRDGFKFGERVPLKELGEGITEMPYTILGDTALAFVEACYEADWVMDFDWPEWIRSGEANGLTELAAVRERATPLDLAKLLTALIRQDRFVEGALMGAFESGLLTAITERAATLLASGDQTRSA